MSSTLNSRVFTNPFPLLFGYTVFLASVQSLTLALSAAGVTIAQPVALGILVLSATTGILTTIKTQGASTDAPAASSRWTLVPGLGLGALAFAAYIFLWSVAYAKPPMDWDGLHYHLPTIHFWALEGRVHWIQPGPGLSKEGVEIWLDDQIARIWNGFPMGAEAFAFLLVRATGDSNLVNTVNLVYLPLGALGLALLGRIFGLRPFYAWLAALLYVFLPVTMQQAASILVDSAFTSCVLALMACLAWWFSQFRANDIHWAHTLALGAAAGLTLGHKLSGPLLAGIGGTVFVALIFFHNFLRKSSDRIVWRRLTLHILAAAAITVLSGGYWAIRNIAHTGNPFWPIEITIAGKALFTGAEGVPIGPEEYAAAQAEFPLWRMWTQGGVDPSRGIMAWPGSLLPYNTWTGGIGYAWLLGGLPAVILVALGLAYGLATRRHATRELAPVFFALLALVVISFLGIPGAGRARYSLWIYGIGLPSFLLAVQYLLDRARKWKPALALAPLAWLLLVLGVTLYEGGVTMAYWTTRAYVSVQRGDATWPAFAANPRLAARAFWWYDPVGYVWPQLSTTVFEDILRGRDPVALGPLEESGRYERRLIIGQLSQPVGARPIHFLDRATARDPKALDQFIAQRRIRYVIWDYFEPPPATLEKRATRDHSILNLFKVYEF